MKFLLDDWKVKSLARQDAFVSGTATLPGPISGLNAARLT